MNILLASQVPKQGISPTTNWLDRGHGRRPAICLHPIHPKLDQCLLQTWLVPLEGVLNYVQSRSNVFDCTLLSVNYFECTMKTNQRDVSALNRYRQEAYALPNFPTDTENWWHSLGCQAFMHTSKCSVFKNSNKYKVSICYPDIRNLAVDLCYTIQSLLENQHGLRQV